VGFHCSAFVTCDILLQRVTLAFRLRKQKARTALGKAGHFLLLFSFPFPHHSLDKVVMNMFLNNVHPNILKSKLSLPDCFDW